MLHYTVLRWEETAQLIDDVTISSTKIRKALVGRDVSKAADYLGYSYPITGASH